MAHHPTTHFRSANGLVTVRRVPARFGLVAFAVFVGGVRHGRPTWSLDTALTTARNLSGV